MDCGKSVELYEESAEQLAADQRVYKERAEAISKAMNKGSQGGSVFETSREPPRRIEDRPSLGPQTTSPVFETARENYETRQNFRKQNALQQRKQRVQSETPRPQTVSQQQLKVSDVSFTNKPFVEEEEQQVLSETASFAAAQGKRFGKQYFQQSLNSLNPSSVAPQSSTQSPQPQSVSFTTSTQTFQSSRVPSFDQRKVSFVTPSTESSISFSSSQAESFSPEVSNEFSSSSSSTGFSSSSTFTSTTPPPLSSAQRNFKPNNRLLPTSSQNNNFRRSKAFRNRQAFESLKTKTTEGASSYATQSTADPSSIGSSPFSTTASENEATSSLQSSTAFLNSFSRPSIDLIPPHDANFVPKPNSPQSSSQNTNQNLRATAKINSKNINRQGRNRFANLSTKPPVQYSSPNSFSSPAKSPGIDEALTEKKYKQRRLPSTTEKPVFTVKFRPNKSFSYIELERTSPESSTPKNIQLSSTERPQFSSSANVDPIVQFTTSTREPHAFSSSSFPSSSLNSLPSSDLSSSSSFSPSFTPSSSSISYLNSEGGSENFEVTETPYIEEKYQTEWTPTHSPKLGFDNGMAQSNVPSAPSYSPTVPEKVSLKDSFSSQQTSQFTSSAGFENKESLLDKLADFSNIDPAEINLLPSSGKKVAKANTRIPDSAGPNALHTLALYYATSESDQGTTPAYVSSDSPSTQPRDLFQNVDTNLESLIDESTFGNKQETENNSQQKVKVSDEILLRSHSGSPDNETEFDEIQATVQSADAVKDLSSVLTKATKDSFSFLFNDTKAEPQPHTHSDEKPCTGDDIIDLDATKETVTEKAINVKEDVRNDLESDQSRGIVQPKPTTSTTTAKNPFNQFSAAFDDLPDELKLRDSTDLRELAQVFSRALSAYLEDPDSFRRILSEVRPTEPTGLDFATASSIDEHEDEVLDFSDASSTGPRLIPSTQNTVGQDPKVSVNSVDVEQINDLVQTNNVSDSSLPSDLTAPTIQAANFDSPLYTTINPAFFANDINLLSVDTNHTSAESLTENTYFPTSGGVDDQSRPRYGGFQNNSVSSDYKPYGAEVLNGITGRPIASSFATEAPVSVSTFDSSIVSEVDRKNYSTSASNQIDIESIPDQLGIVPAHDINSLFEAQDEQLVPSHFQDHFVPEDSHEIIQTEEEIYGRGSDQENLLIASGSQSLVSRDNYVRFLGSKQEQESKSSFSLPQQPGVGFTKSADSAENNQATPTIRGRGSVKFGPSVISSPSNFKRRQNKEVTFQNVNLGNGITLERTKTTRYSTIETKPSTIVPFGANEANFNPVQINEQLGFIPEKLAASTENPIQNIQTTRFGVRATTYHPETNKPELPDVIPPRGSVRGSWKWNSQEPNLSNTNTVEQYTSTQANQESSTAFSNFVSTLLPPNVTIETAGEEMLEKKAEEIFGKLNKTSADMLMNVMNQAESNMTVRRLVLLLVADRNGRERSFEESRSQLIQALLQTSATLPETTSSLEQSTERLDKSTPRKPERTRGRSRSYPTVAPAASTQQTTKIPRGRGSKALRGNDPEKSSEKSTAQNERRVNPPQYLRSPNLFPSKQSTATFGTDPDGRAVELLKTLYNLAARWG